MINFLVIDNLSIIPKTYFKYIVQFNNTLDAEIWFLENGFETTNAPFYKDSLECTPVNEKTVEYILTFAKNNNLKKFILIESTENYRVLCFTETERNNFTAERIQGSKGEELEFTEVEPMFIYGFVNVPKN